MCIAILNNKKALTTATLQRCWENNPEGAGLLWSEAGKVKTFKTFKESELINKYFAVRNKINTPIVLHFRIATSGEHNLENLHPFEVNERLAFVHNGIIFGLGNSEHSDTYQFNERLKGLPKDFLNTPFVKELLSVYVESSKLVFLDGDGVPTIVNEHLGTWESGSWFSNSSHKETRFVYFGNQKVEKANYKAKKATKTPALSNRSDIDAQSNIDLLRCYFTEVTQANVEAIARELDTTSDAYSLVWEIEDKAREFSTYSLSDLLNRMRAKATTYASYSWKNNSWDNTEW